MKFKARKNSPVNKLKFCNLSYVFGLFEKPRYTGKKFNINLVAKTTRKLKHLIHSKIDPVPNDEIAVIYIIQLRTETQEEKVYMGMTGRKFKDRLKEHVSDITFNRQTTALARFNLQQHLNIRFNEARIIMPTSHFHMSLIKESIEFLTHFKIEF